MRVRRVLLLRKGRVLTPRSRLQLRIERIRHLRTAGLDTDVVLALSSLVLRLVSMPVVVALDYLAWPVVVRTLGRGSWWIVELKWHGPDAELVRVHESPTEDEARRALAGM